MSAETDFEWVEFDDRATQAASDADPLTVRALFWLFERPPWASLWLAAALGCAFYAGTLEPMAASPIVETPRGTLIVEGGGGPDFLLFPAVVAFAVMFAIAAKEGYKR